LIDEQKEDKVSQISRREFIHISALAAAGVTLAACAQATEAPPEEPTAAPETGKEQATATPAPQTEPVDKEAPALATQVRSGALPPLDERLPATPFVVGPGVRVLEEDLDWEVGTYEGGVLRAVTTNPTWSYPCQHGGETILNSPSLETGPITGNIVESVSINDDVTEFSFTLRKGLRWSDGEPVTMDDVRFGWEDVNLNEQITPTLSTALKAGADPAGEPVQFEFVDDYTFTCTFADSNVSFLINRLGVGYQWGTYNWLIKPKHYLEQWHTEYTPVTDLRNDLEAEGLTEGEWHRLFAARGGTWGGSSCAHEAEELPVLRGWIVVPSPEDQIIMERNPYYHKVDTDGKQLPYVGRIEAKVVATSENIPSTIITGEINFCREILRHTDVGLYKEHEGDAYVVNLDMVYHNAPVAFMLNYNNPDETWQQVVLDKRFRQAVNAAIKEQEIIDALYLGFGRHSPYFPAVDDPDRANALLDEMGMDQRDEEGYRLAPNGERFEIFMEVVLNPLFAQPAELVASHLDAVGLRTPLKQIEQALWVERRDANELYASVQWLNDTNWPYVVDDYMPTSRIRWGQRWDDWMRTEGEEGIEPPDWIKELYDIRAELQSLNPNTTAAEVADNRLAEWMMEYIPIFPVARDVADPVIVPPNLANVPHSGYSSPMMFAQEQLFFKQE
jgi:peptide/nickel transport system substrate-binding protein